MKKILALVLVAALLLSAAQAVFAASPVEAFRTAEQTDDREPEASRFDFYNALYPWNDGVDFAKSSVVLEPERSGILYFRVNAAPKNLKRNGGRVKVQIKLLD